MMQATKILQIVACLTISPALNNWQQGILTSISAVLVSMGNLPGDLWPPRLCSPILSFSRQGLLRQGTMTAGYMDHSGERSMRDIR